MAGIHLTDLLADAPHSIQYMSAPTIELTWALILASARHISSEAASVRDGGWQCSLGDDQFRLGRILFRRFIVPALLLSLLNEDERRKILTLQNASSIAALMLTTEALVADIQEERQTGAAGRPNGFRNHLCMKCSALSALTSGREISRGRHRDTFSESRIREIPQVRFDERGVKTEAWFRY